MCPNLTWWESVEEAPAPAPPCPAPPQAEADTAPPGPPDALADVESCFGFLASDDEPSPDAWF